jgi:aminoglycoside phosphotransferase (APT) family kinase protein
VSLPRRGVDLAALLARMDSTLAGVAISEIGEGWDNHAYAVDAPGRSRLVLRVSKLLDVEDRREVAGRDRVTLAFIRRHTAVATNAVVACDLDEGALLLTHVPGVPVGEVELRDPRGFGTEIGRMLADLHAAPAGDLGPEWVAVDPEGWLRHTADELDRVGDRIPVADRAAFAAFLARPAPAAPGRKVLCHNDLGEDHLLVDPRTQRLTGIIDVSDAVVGDPARDFALLLLDLGEETLAGALAAYGQEDPGLAARAGWFAVRAGLAGLAWRLRAEQSDATAALERLRRVLGRCGSA